MEGDGVAEEEADGADPGEEEEDEVERFRLEVDGAGEERAEGAEEHDGDGGGGSEAAGHLEAEEPHDGEDDAGVEPFALGEEGAVFGGDFEFVVRLGGRGEAGGEPWPERVDDAVGVVGDPAGEAFGEGE